VEVWGSAWRWVSRLDADLIKKTPGLSVEAVNIAGKYQEGLKNLGLSDKVKEVGRELQELQSRLVSKYMINTH
jgi:hypothetical protein